MTSGNLWNFYRDKIDDVHNKASDGKSFKYKTKIIEETEARPVRPAQPDPDQRGNQPPQPDQTPIPPLNFSTQIIPL